MMYGVALACVLSVSKLLTNKSSRYQTETAHRNPAIVLTILGSSFSGLFISSQPHLSIRAPIIADYRIKEY